MISNSYYLLRMLQKSKAKRLETSPSGCTTFQGGKCRSCYKRGTITISNNPTIIDALQLFGGIDVSAEDEFTQFICENCHTFLQNAIKFRKVAKKTETLLRQPTPSSHETTSSRKQPVAKPATADESDIKPKRKYVVTKKVQCIICNKHLPHNFFTHHMASHAEDNYQPQDVMKVKCAFCKKIKLLKSYKQHLISHGEKSHMCELCGKRFLYKNNYTQHLMVHKGEFPFKCQLCPYRAHQSGLLKTHMLSHKREYRHFCPQCPAKYFTNSNLRKHMLIHKGKQFLCDSCKKGYFTKSQLDKHIEVAHLGIRSHVCQICDKAFGYRKPLLVHQKRVHNFNPPRGGRIPAYLKVEMEKQQQQQNLLQSQ